MKMKMDAFALGLRACSFSNYLFQLCCSEDGRRGFSFSVLLSLQPRLIVMFFPLEAVGVSEVTNTNVSNSQSDNDNQ